jgi:cell division septation protein DedD
MIDNNQKNEALFLQLVLTFQTAAWQQMGKIKNPITDKIERDLNQARFSIDMLEMIRSKTHGNLTDNEKQLLDKSISELQLNFVDEFNKEQKEKEKEEKTKKSEEKGKAESTEETAEAKPKEEKEEEGKVKSTKKTAEAKPKKEKEQSKKKTKKK